MSDFKSNPKLQNLDPVKLKLIMQVMESSKGKSMEEMLPQIMQINTELKKRNMDFSKSETDLLMDALMENMSPSEKKKLKMMRSFMQL